MLMENIKKITLLSLFMLLGGIIYFDFLSENKLEYWTLFRSSVALLLLIILSITIRYKK